MEENEERGNLSTKISKRLLKRFKVEAFEEYSGQRDWLRRAIVDAIRLWLKERAEESIEKDLTSS